MLRGALVLLAAAGASALPARAGPPDVVLVTLDTVRADRMGFLGSRRGLTPNLDALARESLVFERAYAQAPLTTVSHATILSGTSPPFHRAQDFGLPLPAAVPYLPALLEGAGYHTAAFVGSLILDPRGAIAPGFDRGFEVYDAGFRRRREGEDPFRTKERRGADVVARALAWLDRRPPGPLFLWVHLYDAHDPYDPPAPFAARFAREPYDGEVAAVDAAVGALLAGLRDRRLFAGALVLVLSDHGEGLGDHGEATHGVFLYDATIHVPLLVRPPKGQGGGRRIAARVSLKDVAPTVLEAAGVAAPSAMRGRSLLAVAADPRPDDRPSYAESEYPRRVFGWSALASWRAERFLWVEAPRPELYDLRADPAATHNLAEERPAVARGMAAQVAAARGRGAGPAPSGPEASVDSALVERLASLGYASGGGAAAPHASGIDPKDKIEVTNLLHDASLAAEDGRLERAIPLFERVVATDPQVLNAQLELGLALARRREWTRAVDPLRAAVARMPDLADARFTLGLAYASVGRPADAVGELQAALAREPGHVPARRLLADVYARLGRAADADRERSRLQELESARPPMR